MEQGKERRAIMIEQWLPIEGYDGLYEVSNFGRFRSVSRVYTRSNGLKQTLHGKILHPAKYKREQLRIQFIKNKICKNYMACHLVMNAFKGKHPTKKHIKHLDGNKENNRLDNLEWSHVRPKWGTKPKVVIPEFSDVDEATGLRWRYVRWTNNRYKIFENGKIKYLGEK